MRFGCSSCEFEGELTREEAYEGCPECFEEMQELVEPE